MLALVLHRYGNAGRTDWYDVFILLPVASGATWALSALSYNTIEEPFLRVRRGYGQPKPAHLASAA